MTRLFVRAVLLLALVVGPLGCGHGGLTPQTTAAIALSNTLDLVGEALVLEYARQGQAIIDAAKSRQEAETKLAALDQRWSPVWASWISLRRSHDRWAKALEQGGLEEEQLATLLVGAVCDLREAVRATGAAIPLLDQVPIPCPEVAPAESFRWRRIPGAFARAGSAIAEGP